MRRSWNDLAPDFCVGLFFFFNFGEGGNPISISGPKPSMLHVLDQQLQPTSMGSKMLEYTVLNSFSEKAKIYDKYKVWKV